MGARPNRSTELALELIVEQIREAWKAKKVASLLSLDIVGAFDRVLPERLTHVLRTRRIPEWMIRWVASFTSERRTSLFFEDRDTAQFHIPIGVPQGSPCSPVLFLFYLADLHDACDSPANNVSVVGFSDDTQLIAFGNSEAQNCQNLKTVHEKCAAWAYKTGMSFAPQKYELIHFTKKRRQRPVPATHCLRLQNATITPDNRVKILGVWLDEKLTWEKHIKITRLKTEN